ncbi:MAG: hypothetical protein ABH879_08570 [archaeon]
MFFRKKKEEDEEEVPEEAPVRLEAPLQTDTDASSLIHLKVNVDKLSAQFSTFFELQKAATERFTRVNEQIGELRSMLIERDKQAQHIEAKATQAIDLVSTVQPDKLMADLRKEDGKVDAIRCGLEAKDSMLKSVSEQVKDLRNTVSAFKGMDQMIKLNEDVKAELTEIRKMKALVDRRADKIETIFSELQNRLSDFAKLNARTADMDQNMKQLSTDLDAITVKMTGLATKKELKDVMDKFTIFQTRTGNVVDLLNRRHDKHKRELTSEFDRKLEKAEKLLKGFEVLVEKTPDLNKYFNLLEGQITSETDLNIEKIQAPSDETALEEPPKKKEEPPKKKGILHGLKSLRDKISKD